MTCTGGGHELQQVRSFGCELIDVREGDSKDQGSEGPRCVPEVDCAVDAVGFEARGHGSDVDHEAPAMVLTSIMDLTRAGGKLGIPGALCHRRCRRHRRRRPARFAVDQGRLRPALAGSVTTGIESSRAGCRCARL
jgi:threonine dehydrogenase-like Zn-dependent dehydrogenase